MPGMRPSAPPRCGVSRPTTTAHRMQVGSSANGADPTFITRSAQQSRNRMNALTRSDLFTLEAYASERAAFRARVIAHKKHRQVPLGEHVNVLFEERTPIPYQVQEMLRIQRIIDPTAIQDDPIDQTAGRGRVGHT